MRADEPVSEVLADILSMLDLSASISTEWQARYEADLRTRWSRRCPRVSRDQFRDGGELAVLHVPTGHRFSTHPYERAEDMSEVIATGLNQEPDTADNDYDPVNVAGIAFRLLRERLATGWAKPAT